MIRNTIERTKKSTFLVRVPSTIPEQKGFPAPNGTGFFISSDGYFLTANHVIQSVDSGTKLMLSQPELVISGNQISHIDIVKQWSEFDIALLKVDFIKNSSHPLLKNRTGFHYLDIDFNNCLDGTPVYSYGFPLPEVDIKGVQTALFAFEFLCPRVTSAIISSHHDAIGPIQSAALPKWYVIDKALNYGNSGGPIILAETGKAIAVCARFQPVDIPQMKNTTISVPSLYSIASSLANIKGTIKNLIKSG